MEEYKVKKILMVIMVVFIFNLTGCVSKSNDLSDEGYNAVTEYIASELLQYDASYNEKLVYELESTPTPIPEPTAVQSALPENTNVPVESPDSSYYENNSQVTATIPTTVKLSEIYNTNDFEITYSSFDLYDSYPKDSEKSYYTFTAGKNNKFLIIDFNIKNLSDKSKTLNLMQNNIKYQLIVNGNLKYNSLLTVLENDITYLDLKFKTGESKKAVLTFEVPKDIEIKSAQINVMKDDITSMIHVK